MKKLLFLLLLVATMAACKDDPKEFRIKDTDMISILPANFKAITTKDVEPHLTPLEIVKQASDMSLKLYWGDYGYRAFTDELRDTVSTPPKLLMWATDVITLEGELQEELITAVDVVIRKYDEPNSPNTDTIAYIPNSVLRAAEAEIRAAYDAKDIEECYRLFNEAYKFIPITGAEWRALKASGEN